MLEFSYIRPPSGTLSLQLAEVMIRKPEWLGSSDNHLFFDGLLPSSPYVFTVFFAYSSLIPRLLACLPFVNHFGGLARHVAALLTPRIRSKYSLPGWKIATAPIISNWRRYFPKSFGALYLFIPLFLLTLFFFTSSLMEKPSLTL